MGLTQKGRGHPSLQSVLNLFLGLFERVDFNPKLGACLVTAMGQKIREAGSLGEFAGTPLENQFERTQKASPHSDVQGVHGTAAKNPKKAILIRTRV